jgi:flagellar biosynthesis/type III secretory pathway M-ring protein FliF/YscJ
MSDLGSIGILAALLFLFAVFLAFIKNVIDELRNRNKQPKTSVKKAKVSDNSQTRNSEEPEHNVTYGQDTFEQEDDEFHEEVW